MIVYGINKAKENLLDKARMVVCSVEVHDLESKSRTMDMAIKKLRPADNYYEVTHWMTKEKFNELYY